MPQFACSYSAEFAQKLFCATTHFFRFTPSHLHNPTISINMSSIGFLYGSLPFIAAERKVQVMGKGDMCRKTHWRMKHRTKNWPKLCMFTAVADKACLRMSLLLPSQTPQYSAGWILASVKDHCNYYQRSSTISVLNTSRAVTLEVSTEGKGWNCKNGKYFNTLTRYLQLMSNVLTWLALAHFGMTTKTRMTKTVSIGFVTHNTHT